MSVCLSVCRSVGRSVGLSVYASRGAMSVVLRRVDGPASLSMNASHEHAGQLTDRRAVDGGMDVA